MVQSSRSHLCRGSEDTELQLWTDSRVEDFRGPTGDGSRLPLDGEADSRFPDVEKDAVRRSSSPAPVPMSSNPESEGRTRIGGT